MKCTNSHNYNIMAHLFFYKSNVPDSLYSPHTQLTVL